MYLLELNDCQKVNGAIVGTATGFIVGAVVASPFWIISAIAQSGPLSYQNYKFIQSVEEMGSLIVNASMTCGNDLENKLWNYYSSENLSHIPEDSTV